MTSADDNPKDVHGRTRSEVIQWAQLATLVCGLVIVSMTLGRKDEKLDGHDRDIGELKSVTIDLTKHAVRSESQMIDLYRRLEAIEQRRQ